MPTSSCPEAKSLSLSVSSEAWEKVVSFPPNPSQEDDRLENLIVATMLTFKSAGPDRKSIISVCTVCPLTAAAMYR
ncbi:Uncharacterised protein [Klebsiella variicola]|nr:hypothetical protein L366_00319 [Klebsiella variicola]VTO58978.1 Uncharacterised protein [Klebsiella variicola]